MLFPRPASQLYDALPFLFTRTVVGTLNAVIFVGWAVLVYLMYKGVTTGLQRGDRLKAQWSQLKEVSRVAKVAG